MLIFALIIHKSCKMDILTLFGGKIKKKAK